MGQSQHYNPQTYLKQWCTDGELFEYRRVGRDAKLVEDRKSPRGIACELDLYTLPVGGVANGMTGDEIEQKLARDVDRKLPGIVEAASLFSGLVRDEDTARMIRWLMRTFVARNPVSMGRAEDGYPDLVEKHNELLARLEARAATAAMKEELRKFRDPRMPRVMTRATVAAVVDGASPPGNRSWLDGDVHVLQAADFGPVLDAAGAGEFVTFHQPVMDWESPMVASFSLSPAAMALIVESGFHLDATTSGAMVWQHTIAPLPCRRSLYCRTAAKGTLLARAATLIPW